jgi:hypothetical protein
MIWRSTDAPAEPAGAGVRLLIIGVMRFSFSILGQEMSYGYFSEA